MFNIKEGLKDSWLYPIFIAGSAIYGNSVITDVDLMKKMVKNETEIMYTKMDSTAKELKSKVEANVSEMKDKMDQELKAIQDLSLQGFNLQQQVSQKVIETFKFSTNFNSNQIEEIKKNKEALLVRLETIDKEVGNIEKKSKNMLHLVEENEAMIKKVSDALKENGLEASFKRIEEKINEIQERLDLTLGDLEKERVKARKLLEQIPGSEIDPDVFTNPIGTCVVIKSVNLRAGPGTDKERLGMLKRGTHVDLLKKTNDGWLYLRHLTRLGFAVERYLKCNLR